MFDYKQRPYTNRGRENHDKIFKKYKIPSLLDDDLYEWRHDNAKLPRQTERKR